MAGNNQFKLASTPTVFPATNFDPESDATRLKNAMKCTGTDEDTIIDILTHRDNTQRLQIARTFETMFGKNLVQELKSELRGDFEDVIVALMTPLPEFYAREIFDAIAGSGTNGAVLIEVLASSNYYGNETITDSYKKLFGTELAEDIQEDPSGEFKKLLVSLCRGKRDEDQNGYVNSEAATADAQRLLEAGKIENKYASFLLNPDACISEETLLTNIMVFRSYSQLRSIFDEYELISGISIEDSIIRDFSGDLEDGFLALVTCVRNQTIYFAEKLHAAFTRLDADEKTLIRIIVTRSEIDLGDIKTEYEKKYKRSLAVDIERDCAGDRRKLLIAMLG